MLECKSCDSDELKKLRKDVQLAEKKVVALQHRSRAESSQANSLFLVKDKNNKSIEL